MRRLTALVGLILSLLIPSATAQTIDRVEQGTTTHRSARSQLGTIVPSLPPLVEAGEQLGPIDAILANLSQRSFANSVAWSPDGRSLASGSSDNTIHVWDVATARETARLEGHMDWVRSVTWSPDGRSLASGSWDNTIRLWDVATARETARLEGHTSAVNAVAWSPDGRSVASGADDSTIRLWDIATASETTRLEGHTSAVNAVAWSPDGRNLASGADDSTIRLWDVATARETARLEGHTSAVNAVAWSPDGRSLASGSGDNTIRLWDVATARETARLEGHTSAVNAVAWSPDGRSLASGSGDNTIRLWDVATARETARLEGHTSAVNAVAWSPDGRSVASGSSDKTIRLWDIATAREIARLEGHTSAVNAVAWSPDGRSLASGADDSTIRLWDIATAREIARLEGHTSAVNAVAWSPDGRSLASGADDSTIRLWNIATARETARLEGHTDWVRSVAWSPDGRSLASGSGDNTIRVWDVATARETARLEGHTDWVRSVTWSPDGRSLASGSWDNTIRLWDIATARETARLEGHTKAVNVVAWSPDGRSLASGSSDRAIRLWDIATARETARLEGHMDWVRSVTWSPDGRSLASGSSDRTIRLWDIATAEEAARLEGHTSAVNAVAWSPDKRSLASVSLDSTIRLWDVATARETAIAVGGQRRTWLFCRRHDRLCLRYDDGALARARGSNGQFAGIAPNVPLGAVTVVEAVTDPLRAIEGKGLPIRVKIALGGTAQALWVRLRGEGLPAGPDRIGLNVAASPVHAPIRPGEVTELAGWISVLTPHSNPAQGTITLNLVVDAAGQAPLALPPIEVAVGAAKPEVQQANIGASLPQGRHLLATLINVGDAPLQEPIVQGSIGDPWAATEMPLGTASMATAAAVLAPGGSSPISFFVPTDIAGSVLKLQITDNVHPLHKWSLDVPVEMAAQQSFAVVMAALAAIVAGVLIYYVRTYRHPLVVRLSGAPTALLALDVEELPRARRLLARTGRLEMVLRGADSAQAWLDAAADFAAEKDPAQRVAVLARRLETAAMPVLSDDNLMAFRLDLPDEFPLNVPSCLLAFARPGRPEPDILVSVRDCGAADPVVLIVAADTAQYGALARALDERAETVVMPTSSDLSRLLLVPRPLDALARLIAGRIALSRISPYQVNEGVRRNTVFFGRARELAHILNREPANYIILGARQLGKSSLLRAIERQVGERKHLAVEYRVVGSEPATTVLARVAGLPETAALHEIAASLRQPVNGRPRLLLLDEADLFVEADAHSDPPFAVLDALRSLSAEGYCYFVLAGFWKLFEVAHADYFTPVRNFGETLVLGPLEEGACTDLILKPMEALGISYAHSALVGRIVEQTGRRPNLIQVVCTQIIAGLGSRRVVLADDVSMALESSAVRHVLEGWGRFTIDQRASQFDRIIVWAMLEVDQFDLGTVLECLKTLGAKIKVEEARLSLVRLELGYIFSSQFEHYRWRVPLFRTKLRSEQPDLQLAEELDDLTFERLSEMHIDSIRLFSIDIEEIPSALRLLRRRGGAENFLRDAEVDEHLLEAAASFATEDQPASRAAMLAKRLESKAERVPTSASLAAFQLILPDHFPLHLQSCLLAFAEPAHASAEVLTAVLQASAVAPVTLLVAVNTIQYNELMRVLDTPTENVILVAGSDLSRLLLMPRPLEVLARLMAGRIALSLISPYQINEGLRRETVFFGRAPELTHILNREPANYIVIGARQLGKSSLLKAIERRARELGQLAVDYRVVGAEPVTTVLARAAGMPEHASLSDTVAALRQPGDGRPRLLLLDEADQFVEADARTQPPFAVLDALRSLSAEGRCFFILAGFWKLFEVAHADYFAPIRNFGETLTLGPLEDPACRDLLCKPMATLGISYADPALVDRIVAETGRRPNLIQIICTEIIRRLGTRRVIEAADVDAALDSNAVGQALEGWGRFTTDPRGARLDRIVVWAMLAEDGFDLEAVLQQLAQHGAIVLADDVRTSLVRLDLAFVIGESGGVYRWRVPLFRERRRREAPAQQLADELAALHAAGLGDQGRRQ